MQREHVSEVISATSSHKVLPALLVAAACGSPGKTETIPPTTDTTPPEIGTTPLKTTTACHDQGRLSVTMRSTKRYHRACFVPEGEEIALRVGADHKPDLTGETFWTNT